MNAGIKARRSRLGWLVWLVGAGFGCQASWAANADKLEASLDVKPVAGSASAPSYTVSVSRAGLDSYISYRLKVTNGGGNTVNQVSVTAKATVTPEGAGIASYAAFVNVAGANPNCPAPPVSPNPPTDTVTCPIGQLKAGEGREFFLIFRAPEAGATVEFNGTTVFSSGNSQFTPPADFNCQVVGTDVRCQVTNSMMLVTTQQQEVDTSVITVLPPKGGKFFIGANGQPPNATNLFTTQVTVPPTEPTEPTSPPAVVTDNRIVQDIGPSFPCDVGYFCYGLGSTISVDDAAQAPGTKVDFTPYGAKIIVTLQQDASSLAVKKPVPAIADVRIYYQPNPPSGPVNLVGPCTGSLPTTDVPCVAARNDKLKGKKGYYEYVIWARDNGRFSW